MSLIYITKQSDTVDYIVWKQYGTTANGIVEQVLQANHGLADHGAILPAGINVVLPVFEAKKQTKAAAKLWD